MNVLSKCECIRISQLPISSHLLKESYRNTSLIVLTKTTFMEKVFCYLNISNYYCNSCDQNPWKYIFRSSFLEMNFQKIFVSDFCQDFNPKFQSNFFEEQSQQLYLILVVSQQIIYNTSQQILTLQYYSEECK